MGVLKRVRWILILAVVIPVAAEAAMTRNGTTLVYRWAQIEPDGRSVNLEFSMAYPPGGPEYMQRQYRSKHHGYRSGHCSSFIFNDPFQATVHEVAIAMIGFARSYQIDEVECALSFVQSLDYAAGMGDYQRYAAETLIDGRGDCSDKSVLLGAILSYLCYDWVFLEFSDHLMVGVWSQDDLAGEYVSSQGRRYFCCETTEEGKQVGYCRSEYQNTEVRVEHPTRKGVLWQGPYRQRQ